MGLVIYQVDAFTKQPFSGNPAAVCILPTKRSSRWMQALTSEMNLSETAFLVAEEEGFELRWFTPKKEVSLCGHAALASAHVLYERGVIHPNREIQFYTLSGLLTARLQPDNWIELDFPTKQVSQAEPPDGLLQALGISEPLYVGQNTSGSYLIEIENETILQSLSPDSNALVRTGVNAVMVTSVSKGEYDFTSRNFAPRMGTPEDPVTGSAHCTLGPYWQRRMKKNSFFTYQASSRGGSLKVVVVNDRVLLYGQAVTVAKSELLVRVMIPPK